MSQPDAMNYFTALKDAGKVQFYGNLSFELDNTVVNLVDNVESEMKSWLARCVHGEEQRAEAFRHVIQEPRPPRPHQEKAVSDVLKYCKEDAQSKTLGAMTLTPTPTPTRRTTTRAAVVMATGSGKTYTSFLSVITLERDEELRVTQDVRDGQHGGVDTLQPDDTAGDPERARVARRRAKAGGETGCGVRGQVLLLHLQYAGRPERRCPAGAPPSG